MRLLNPFLHHMMLPRAPEDGTGGGDPGAGGEPAGGKEGAKSFFQPGEGGGEGGDPGAGGEGGDPGAGGEGGEGGERPEWLLEKYKTPEDQAKAYRDLYGRFSKKTDDLRAEVKDEMLAEYGKSIGVPDDASGYEYPKGFQKPDEGLDGALRDWAKANNVAPEAFQNLIKDVWGQTQANHEAEVSKLGENSEQRIDTLNRWINANVDKSLFPQVGKVMQTADGVQLMEAMMKRAGDNGFTPDENDGLNDTGKALSRGEIRELQSDPRFGTDEDYTKMVRAHWAAYGQRQGK